MNITVVGTGYVGLVGGTCFAEVGHKVVCVDIDAHKVSQMQAGVIPIYEPGLESVFKRNSLNGNLSFTTDLSEGVQHSDIIFLALPTPPGADGAADLSYILNVAKQIGPMINSYKVVVDKSTVPVGTAEKVSAAIAEHCDTTLFDVVSNPEFLREGVAVDDFMKPDRVVIGSESQAASALMAKLYKPFVDNKKSIIHMDLRSAEMTKYAANAYLAMRITFMNEVANLCEKVEANVDYVREGIGSDSRIGNRFLYPGVGYGGSCFPKDVEALIRTSKQYDYDFQILQAVTEVNTRQKLKVFDLLSDHFKGGLKGRKIAVWGLAFKPNTDDIREAPALYTIEALLKAGAQVSVFDPEAMDNVRERFGDQITYGNNQYEILEDVDALAIMTEWKLFRQPKFPLMHTTMKDQVIVDGRNLFDLNEIKSQGFDYYSIGRQAVQLDKV